tara:strand:+ start:951 stop:2045 length:1095 start_codon:yes stop_codon:yes gene_type:complete
MAEEKLTMEGLEPIQADTDAGQEAQADEVSEQQDFAAVDEEGEHSDFLEALQAEMSDEPQKAAEPEPEPEPEPAAEPPQETEENLSPSAKNFKKIKEDRDNARRELEELKGQMGSDTSSEDYERIKQDRDKISEELKLIALERHPEFKRKYEQQAASLLNQAKEMVGVGLSETITSLLFSPETAERTERLDDIFAELPVSKQARLANIITEIDKLQDDRQTELNSATETYEKLMESERSQRASNSEANQRLFDEVSKVTENLEFYQTKSGDEEWNNEVKERLGLARKIFTGQSTPEELVMASCWAAVAPKYREAYGAQLEVNRRLKAQIKELTGSNPSVAATGGEFAEAEELGFIEHLNQVMEE